MRVTARWPPTKTLDFVHGSDIHTLNEVFEVGDRFFKQVDAHLLAKQPDAH